MGEPNSRGNGSHVGQEPARARCGNSDMGRQSKLHRLRRQPSGNGTGRPCAHGATGLWTGLSPFTALCVRGRERRQGRGGVACRDGLADGRSDDAATNRPQNP